MEASKRGTLSFTKQLPQAHMGIGQSLRRGWVTAGQKSNQVIALGEQRLQFSSRAGWQG